jgi:serine/threonine protein phosphatase PrpC
MGAYVTNSLWAALEIVVRTDTGLVRGQNEDSVLADARHGLAILADGMGGYNAGEVASSMATTLLASKLAEPLSRRCAIESTARPGSRLRGVRSGRADRGGELGDLPCLGEEEQFGGMGTTLVATVFCDDKVIVAHVGDSRLYRLRGDEFVAMTHDHSVLQEQIDSGLINGRRGASFD